jgi:hypothetical protein
MKREMVSFEFELPVYRVEVVLFMRETDLKILAQDISHMIKLF